MEKRTLSPDYGLDAPGVVRGLLIGGTTALIVGYTLSREATHFHITWAMNLSTRCLAVDWLSDWCGNDVREQPVWKIPGS